jgi:catechol 2,3-dioxygenase-like lactoylglutathione lyase family enzyme
MDWKLEVVIAPFSDVERARAFYIDTLGFRLDSDFHPHDRFRAIQVTPPGSACSIVFGTGLGGGVPPGSLKGAHPRGEGRGEQRTPALRRGWPDTRRRPGPG